MCNDEKWHREKLFNTLNEIYLNTVQKALLVMTALERLRTA